MAWNGKLEQVDAYRWDIPQSYKAGMRVPGRIYATRGMIEQIANDQAPEQVANVATLPGIVGRSMAMPDIHWGYGFPIGGVAAFDLDEGVISPGGVGFDINCGVRLIRTNLLDTDVRPRLEQLVETLFRNVPSGVGSKAGAPRVPLEDVMSHGVPALVDRGFGWAEDAEHTEHGGHHEDASPDRVSNEARQRGKSQIGTLGAGNHFLEIQRVAEIHDPRAADAMGLTQVGQVCVMVHCGSRGFGHQICSDYLRTFERAAERHKIELVDRQLACAPWSSKEAEEYYGAMCTAINYAFSNRQMITHQTRQSFEAVFRRGADDLDMNIVYDVAHNIAKVEEHTVDGTRRKVIVHRKGATRAYPAGHPDVPDAYRHVGQPVMIPGDMGRASWVLVGAPGSMAETFGSTCHGAGRQMSRTAATKQWSGRQLLDDLRAKGIIVKAASMRVAAEEAPLAYKDVNEVVDACHGAGLSTKVVKLEPIGCVKG